MADIQKTIEIIFAGVDNLSGTIEEMGDNLESFGDGVGTVFDPFADAAEKVVKLNAAIGGLGIAFQALRDAYKSTLDDMASKFGTTGERAKELGEIARSVFRDNFGESIQDAANMVGLVEQKFRDFNLDDGAIGDAVRTAFAFDKWGEDTEATLVAVATIMKNFNVGQDVAFDFIARGFQAGLNSAGDFYETVNEYSTQFSSSGAGLDQFFSVIKSGFQEGILGTDKAADAFKEFTLRVVDWKNDTSAAFKAIQDLGLNPDQLLGMDRVTAFQTIIDNLNRVKDSAKQTEIGAALIGTQFEDLKKAALNIDVAAVKMQDFAGAADDVAAHLGTVSNDFQKLWRTVIDEIANVDAFDGISAQIGKVFTDIAAALPGAMSGLDFSGVIGEVKQLGDTINKTLGGIDITTPEGLGKAIQAVIDSIESLMDVGNGIAEAWSPVVRVIGSVIDKFNDLDGDTKELIGNILGIAGPVSAAGAAIGTLGAVIGTIGSGFGTLSAALGTASTAMAGMGSSVAALAGPAGLVLLAGSLGGLVGTLINEYVPGVKEAALSTTAWIDSIINFSGTQGKALESTDAFTQRLKAQLAEEGLLTEQIERKKSALDEVPAALDSIPDEKTAKLGLSTDEFMAAIDQGMTEFEAIDGKTKMTFKAEVDQQALAAAKKTIDDAIPAEKRFEIEADLQKARIEADAATIQAALEFKATVDVAEIEATTKRFEDMFESVNTGLESSGGLLGDLFGDLDAFMGKDATSTQLRYELLDQIEKENELRQRQVDLQEELVRSQVDLMNAKQEALENGEALINVTMDGRFQPALEMMAEEFIRYAQIRATEDGLESLLGL